jgi:hypothetical protein
MGGSQVDAALICPIAASAQHAVTGAVSGGATVPPGIPRGCAARPRRKFRRPRRRAGVAQPTSTR